MSILLPSSNQNIAARGRNKWHKLDQPKPFIEGLITGDINDQISAEAMNAMISGIPSPWARAKLFHSSFGYMAANTNNNTGLGQFSKLILGEWKGLVALLALYPGRISFKQVTLDPNNTIQLLDLKNAMGRMLFEEKDLWKDPKTLPEAAKPFVQLIYYKDKLVGFVSPHTLVCTAAEYAHAELEQDITWFRGGKFNDPMSNIGNDKVKLQKLHLLVNNIRTNLTSFQANLQNNRPNVQIDFIALMQALTTWIQQIGDKLNIGSTVQQGTLDSKLAFVQPYYDLFNIHQYIYYNYSNGVFSRSHTEGAQKFDVRELLLDSPYLAEFAEVDTQQPLGDSAVNYLTVTERSGKKRFYALPLSHLGLTIFQDTLADIVTPSTQPQHALKAEIKDNKLIVRISLCIDNAQQPPIEKEYIIVEQTGTTPKCILWPNFYSVHWTRYYLYSELPRNATGYKLYPFFRDVQIDAQKNNAPTDKLYTLPNDRTSLNFDEGAVKNLIKYPVGQVDHSSHKYELILSNRPIAGIEIRVDREGAEYPCGMLLLKKGQGLQVPNLTSTHVPIQGNNVEVGIDFGSNNTCISYAHNGAIAPIDLKNRRVFLIGTEVIDLDNEYFARPHELMFFQNERPSRGQIKSWIQKPDDRYLQNEALGLEFVAGNPVFEPNINVKSVEPFHILTKEGIAIAHNLKWKNDPQGITSKTGFMKTLFLKICAELYSDERIRPYQMAFKWAYPSALSGSDQDNYSGMYAKMKANIPINNANGVPITMTVEEPMTESQAVCNYAVGPGELAVHENTMMIGIDVGGSTSDILLVSKLNNRSRLIQQGSVRLSAGKLASVIENSNSFAQTILNFAKINNIKIAGIENIVQNSQNSSYYLNAMFDRLEDAKFADFYRDIYHNDNVADRSKSIFAIPAYITGALMYYSGQLIRYALDNNEALDGITTFDLYPFGKGGRLFDWLTARLGQAKANAYYENCLKAGINKEVTDFKFTFSATTRANIKSEVSMGLLSLDNVEHGKNSMVDLVGEEGFKFNNVVLKDVSIIDSSHYNNLGSITFPTEFKRFSSFLDIYMDLISKNKGNFLGNAKQEIESKIPELRNLLLTSINKDPQYIIARKDYDNFGYSQPMFILTAMCFLDKVIIPLVQKETA